METLFDHKPTRRELRVLFGGVAEAELKAWPRSSDTAMGEITHLYKLRGDAAKAGEYLARIEDEQYRFDIGLRDLILS